MAPLPQDADIVAALRSGDETMFAALLDAWSRNMLWLARAYVSTDDSAQEVLQDTWLGVLRGLAGFQGRSAFRTWVYRILVNTAKKRGASESRTVPWSSLDSPTVDPARFRDGHWKEFPSAWPSPEGAALAAETREQIDAALAGLPPRQRAVITLRDAEGYSSAEVCAILEITAINQRVVLHRARAAVREHMDKYLERRA